MHGNAIEEITVLLEHIRFWPFANNRRSGEHKHVIDFLNGNMQTDTLAGPKSPHNECLTTLYVRARLVRQFYEKIECPACCINGV